MKKPVQVSRLAQTKPVGSARSPSHKANARTSFVGVPPCAAAPATFSWHRLFRCFSAVLLPFCTGLALWGWFSALSGTAVSRQRAGLLFLCRFPCDFSLVCSPLLPTRTRQRAFVACFQPLKTYTF